MSVIKQKDIVIKTSNATLTYTEMGDIVVNSSSNRTITLPIPNTGLWYRISNVETGVVTVKYGETELTSLKQTEQCLCLANGTSSWFFSKGGGGEYELTKENIETVLTGEISSHSHAFNDNVLDGELAPTTSTAGTLGQLYVETTTPKLYYCSAINNEIFTWEEVGSGGIAEIPQATETVLGGIKAKAKTGETIEAVIDKQTGKLYVGHTEPITNGDTTTPELLFYNGDLITGEVI